MPGKHWFIHCDYSLPIRQLPGSWWLFSILSNTRCTPKRQDVSNIDRMPCTGVVSAGQQGSLLQHKVLMPGSQLPALSLAQGHSLLLSTVMNMTGDCLQDTCHWQGALPYQPACNHWVIKWTWKGQPLPADCLELLFLSLSWNTVGVGSQDISLHMLYLLTNAALALKH